ncbi:hypothetical protein SDC9_134160 [bioreactor metagenome]|uniref:Uncharacterized protein n=1 Tax=bioreactor metagenome TaxID=1076179 RepID=A0A645DCW4_9ZZZZ
MIVGQDLDRRHGFTDPPRRFAQIGKVDLGEAVAVLGDAHAALIIIGDADFGVFRAGVGQLPAQNVGGFAAHQVEEAPGPVNGEIDLPVVADAIDEDILLRFFQRINRKFQLHRLARRQQQPFIGETQLVADAVLIALNPGQVVFGHQPQTGAGLQRQSGRPRRRGVAGVRRDFRITGDKDLRFRSDSGKMAVEQRQFGIGQIGYGVLDRDMIVMAFDRAADPEVLAFQFGRIFPHGCDAVAGRAETRPIRLQRRKFRSNFPGVAIDRDRQAAVGVEHGAIAILRRPVRRLDHRQLSRRRVGQSQAVGRHPVF